MRDKRFLVIIAHPRLGRLGRFEVPHWGLQLAASLVAVALLAAIGLAAGYFKKAKETERLLSQSEALREEYESLVLTSQEREEQLASLSGLAYQVSIAYGIQRDALEAEDAFGSDLAPAYYASLNQYDRLQDALDRSSLAGSNLLANSTPSIWPVKGYITSAYGRRLDPFHGKGVFHRGIDISAPYGSPVRATGRWIRLDDGLGCGTGQLCEDTSRQERLQHDLRTSQGIPCSAGPARPARRVNRFGGIDRAHHGRTLSTTK